MAPEKKKFISLKVPLLNKEVELFGRTLSDFNGKSIKIDLTNELRGKGVELRFKISADEENSSMELKELNLFGSYIRRMVRKGTDYVEDSFQVKCKDTEVIIKPFLITRKKVSREVKGSLRKVSKEFIIEYVKDKTFENIALDLVNNKLQKELSLKLKKVYPLAFCDVRSLISLNKTVSIKTSNKKAKVSDKQESTELEAEPKEEVKEKKVKKETKPKKEKVSKADKEKAEEEISESEE